MPDQPTDTRRFSEEDEEQVGEGAALIAEERQRQIAEEGWTREHDADHPDGELVAAARCYLASYDQAPDATVPEGWPWEFWAWKPTSDDVRNLVKAGALIAAEIDRYPTQETKTDE